MYEVEDAPDEFWIVCDRCSMGKGKDMWFPSPEDALTHLTQHLSMGHKVPKAAMERLREEVGKPKPSLSQRFVGRRPLTTVDDNFPPNSIDDYEVAE
jgi:hypothetical protein